MSPSAKTECSTPMEFPFLRGSSVEATFDAGDVVSDPGLLLIREFDERVGFTSAIARVLPDPRNPFYIRHPQVELLRQRLYQIIAGYEDCNDATVLRHDSIFKMIAGRGPKDAPAASQPTLSRLENRVHGDVLREINEQLVRQFIATRAEVPEEIVLDVDSTNVDTHGLQQLTFFNAYYDEHVYHPVLVHDAKTGYALAVVLRPGNVGGASEVLTTLSYVVPKVRAAFPKVRLSFRADSGFCERYLLDWLEDEGIRCTVGIGVNKVLERLSADFVKSVEKRYADTHEPLKTYTSVQYKADKWDQARRVVVKCEVTVLGTNVRYVVTSRCGRSRDVYVWYTERGGTSEHYIGELKNGFEGDRLSCRKFEANFFRLLEHTAAYNLMVLFREQIGVPEIARAASFFSPAVDSRAGWGLFRPRTLNVREKSPTGRGQKSREVTPRRMKNTGDKTKMVCPKRIERQFDSNMTLELAVILGVDTDVVHPRALVTRGAAGLPALFMRSPGSA